MITFKSVGHFLAKAFTAVVKGVATVAKSEATVEAVTSVVDPAAVPLERAAYALLGEIGSLLAKGDAAVLAKLADAGLDTAVIQQVQDALKSVPNLIALAKTL